MYHFMRKYNKKLLAVFAAGLMVIFILPSGFRNSGMGYDANVLGKFPDGKTLTVRDVTTAQAEWRMLAGGSHEGVIVRSTPTPTPEQLNEQFNRYRNALPAEFETQPEMNPLDPQSSEAWKARQAADPFGFGYKYPDRVKLQYISISRDEVRKGIRAAQKGNTP